MPDAETSVTNDNPMGTDGFEFVEYTAADTRALERLFQSMGFSAVARHRSKEVVLYRQGDINFLINHEPDSFARAFARVHGPSICAFGLRVADARQAYDYAIKHQAKPYVGEAGPMELNLPAIHGIGGSLIYLIDRYGEQSIYDVDFIAIDTSLTPTNGLGLQYIDHLTHNVHYGRMDQWAGFYQRIFNFKQIRYFDIEGQATGLISKAMTSPCGKIRIPINEPKDSKSQIQEYLDAYHGEGIQHIALGSEDIYHSVEQLIANGVQLLDIPDTYYEAIEQRIPGHSEDIARLQKNKILIDGDIGHGQGLLLQIFTETVIGPIFFEIIQRKGNEGFGEGNFQALFNSIEEDQRRRGVL
ncbi:4-hydroxyphenylpyruvate dioxygenase [Gammaproteobacteria bacterium 53_120_T64]|nr:4-hydroxyphenylpyruvate dioxygenase [Gammaproteobacteria bacterium 53_120_T64]